MKCFLKRRKRMIRLVEPLHHLVAAPINFRNYVLSKEYWGTGLREVLLAQDLMPVSELVPTYRSGCGRQSIPGSSSVCSYLRR